MDSGKDQAMWKHIVAGSMAGASTSFITCPLDVVKTRLQNQSIPKEFQIPRFPSLPSFFASTPNLKNSNTPDFIPKKIYKGTVPSLWRIWNTEGLAGLYKGIGPTLFGYLPAFAIYFSVYSKAKHSYHDFFYGVNNRENSALIHIIAAMTAGASSASFTNPLWVVRTRMMLKEHMDSTTTLQYFKNIWAKEGVRGLYRGLGPSLLGTLHVAIQLPVYEKLKQWQHDRLHSASLDTLHILQCSTLSKIIATVFTYPHEVLRTRIQNQRGAVNLGIIGTVLRIHKEEGWRSFYRGLSTTIMRVVPASAVTFVTYEYVLSQI
jgi:solute carrier family 25 (mitochondrial folate transporter), member 32